MLRTERRYTKQTRDAVRRQNRSLPPVAEDYIHAVALAIGVLIAVIFVVVALVSSSTIFLAIVALVAAGVYVWRKSRHA